MRESTGLILGQWLSIPFIIWGIWLIVHAMKTKIETNEPNKKVDTSFSQNVKSK